MSTSRQRLASFVAITALAALVAAASACGSDGPSPPNDAAADGAGGDSGPAELCTSTGGTVGTQLCCGGVTDFPDTCGVGNCGCSPSASHNVQVCTCQAPKCFAPGKGCKSP